MFQGGRGGGWRLKWKSIITCGKETQLTAVTSRCVSMEIQASIEEIYLRYLT